MKKWIVVLSLLLFGYDAGVAAPASCDLLIEWEAPTTRLDGTFLPIEELEKYTIYVSRNKSTDDKMLIRVEDVLDVTLTSWYLLDVGNGRIYIYMTVTDIYGVSSAYSNMLDIVC